MYWFQRSANHGHAGAQRVLGWWYQDAIGVPKDLQAARTWLLKAAQQGNPDAQNRLGILFMQGQGVTADDAQAVVWFSKAAEQGDGHAQANLAAFYQVGRGVQRDSIQAYKRYRLSEQTGGEDWSGELRDLAKAMTPAEIAEAERLPMRGGRIRGGLLEKKAICWNEPRWQLCFAVLANSFQNSPKQL